MSSNRSIVGKVVPQLCTAGGCDWSVYSIDEATHDTSELDGIGFADDFNYARGGVEEMYELTNCGQFPWGGVTFTSIAVTQDNGAFTPSWLGTYDGGISPQCGYGPTTDTTWAFLPDSSAPYQHVAAMVDGPTQIDSGSVGSWNAELAHEGEPTYLWWWTGILTEGGSSVAGSPTESGYLTLHVIDQVPDTAMDSIYVTVCKPRLHNCPEVVRR